MALDKNNTNIYYLLGRYVAVVERSNNEELSATQMHNIQDCTDNLVRYDRNRTNYTEERMEIMSKVPADGWPRRVFENEDGGRFWIGYYHQKAVFPMQTNIVRHTPEQVNAVTNNEIEELKK